MAASSPAAAGARFAVAMLALAVFILLALAPQLYNDGDTGWHLVAGRLIMATGDVPVTDPFSYTFAGKPWLAHEWLAEVVMAAAYGAGGWSGLSLLFAGAMATLVLIIGAEVARHLRAAPTLIVLILVLFALAPAILARPHVLAWPLLAGWTLLLLRARAAGRAPPLAAAIIMLVWANLHASFIFGLAVAGLFGLEALIAGPDRPRILRAWALSGLAAVTATLVTPFGLHGLLFPFAVRGLAAIPSVNEWRPTVLANEPGFMLVLLAGLFALLYRGVRVPPLRLLLLMLTLYLAFSAVRHQALLGIIGSLVLAAPLGASLAVASAPPAPASPAPAKSRRLGMILATIAMLFAIGRLAVPVRPQDNGSNPGAAIAAVPADLRRRPVLNGYGFGGPLILAGIRPYIDGRVDMYGDAFTFDHDAMMLGDRAAFDRAVARWGIAWTILPPGLPLVARLDRDRRWQRLHADPWAVVHVRREPPGRQGATAAGR